MQKSSYNNQKGFTLVEVMIAVGLFVVVMIAGVGAVLSANSSHKKTQSQRAILDNMSFILEDMSRNIRLGSTLRCPAGVSASPLGGSEEHLVGSISGVTSSDCGPGAGGEARSVAFETQTGDPANDADQAVYMFYTNDRLYKSINGGADFYPISAEGVKFSADSGFTVLGSAPFSDSGTGIGATDAVQPRAVIRLSGTIQYKDILTPFDIQTTVSQRFIDS